MMIVPKITLRRVSMFGVSMIMDKDEAKDFVKSYPEAKVTGYKHGRSQLRPEQMSGPVRSIPVADYLAARC